KPKEQSSAFRAFLCVGDAPGLLPCPGKQKLSAGPHSEITAGVRGWVQAQTRCASCSPQVRGRARLGAATNTVRVLLAAGAGAEKAQKPRGGFWAFGEANLFSLRRAHRAGVGAGAALRAEVGVDDV